MQIQSSKQLFEQAQLSIPGGVNSPVRAFKSVGGTPLFMKSGKGAYLYDEDGNRYIDFIASWGPLILGHAYPPVIKAIQQTVENGTSFGTPTRLEVQMAELIKEMVPNIDMIRMVSSGTEACMSALRLAKGYTGKNKFIKFEGCYHGHADPFLVKAGSGLATHNIQAVPGVNAAIADDTLVASYNDLEGVKEIVKNNAGEVAAIIIEPVAGNMGCIIPAKGFLQGLREICDKESILLIFDEVMTGFRLAAGGAQEYFNVKADIVTYGKVIGAGMPVGAFAARIEIMEHIAPLGKIYQAGTLSGNPVSMIAGYTLLNELKSNPNLYKELDEKTTYLAKGLKEVFAAAKLPVQINQLGSMISVHFSAEPVTDWNSSAASDINRFKEYFHFLLDKGIYLPPSAYESWFLNNALTYEDLDEVINASAAFAKQKTES